MRGRKIPALVEGPSDKGFIEEVLRKLGTTPKVIIMKGNRPDRAAWYVRSLHRDYDKVVILKDLHRYPEEVVKRLMDSVHARLKDDHEAQQAKTCHSAEDRRGMVPDRSQRCGKSLGCRIGHRLGAINPEEIEDPPNTSTSSSEEHAENDT